MSEILADLSGRIVIVGSGLAGLMTALTLAPEPTVIVTRAALGGETSSAWAQGGIAACVGPDDSATLHLADTLAAGDGLCDAKVAARILAEGPGAISALEQAGVEFDRDSAGELFLGLEAAHSLRRIVHAKGDGSGAAIVRALVEAVARTPSITVLEGYEARRLLLDGDHVAGLLCVTEKGPVILPSSRVVLLTECSMSDNVAVHHPDVEFIRPCNLCPHMKRITLGNIRKALEEGQHEVTVDPAIAVAARRAVERMLAI